MEKPKLIGTILGLAVLLCVAIDGVGESFCWYLFYGSMATSAIMNGAFGASAIILAAEKKPLAFAMAANVLGMLLTQDYLNNDVIFYIHDFFSYEFLLIFTYRLGWVALSILCVCVGLFEFVKLNNFYQEVVAFSILIPWSIIKNKKTLNK